ncbi:ESPL1 protein, partial [Picathartes gymnocephalus]|nr:ESPL1 protein [Picathartes gymnocephalus]
VLIPNPDPIPDPIPDPSPDPIPDPSPDPIPDPIPSCSAATALLPTATALSKPLDEALSLWKKLLENPGIPKVRSPEQTVSSLQLLASLYRLQGKPLQALESLALLRSLCRRLRDGPGAAAALRELSRLLLQLECPAHAQV